MKSIIERLDNIMTDIDHYKNALRIANEHRFYEQIRYYRKRILDLLKTEISIRESINDTMYTAAILVNNNIQCEIMNNKILLK